MTAMRNSCADVGVKSDWLEVPGSVLLVAAGEKKKLGWSFLFL